MTLRRTTSAHRIALLGCVAGLGALTAPSGAQAACAYNAQDFSVHDNVFALAGNVCPVTGPYAFQANQTTPTIGGFPVTLPVPYTGFGFLAYNTGVINVTGGGVSIAGYAGPSAYGVYSLGTTADVSFWGSNSVSTTGASAFGLYAAGGGAQITSSGPMVVTTTGSDAHGVVAGTVSTAGAQSVLTGSGVIVLTGGSVTASGAGSDGLVATGASSSITATSVVIVTGSAPSATTGGDGVYAVNGGRRFSAPAP